MDVEHKKTVLEDDSILYQKRDDSLNRKDTSNLTKKQKAQYFKDYYLKRLIIAAVVLIFAGNMIYTILFKHQENILSVAVVGDCYISGNSELTEYLREVLGLTSEDQLLVVTNYNLDDPNQQIAFTTRLVAKDTDILICDYDQFTEYCHQGVYADLASVLPQETYEELSESLVTGHQVQTDEDGNAAENGPEKPYGLDISDSELYQYFGGSSGRILLGVSCYSQNAEAVLTAIDLFTHWEESQAPAAGTEE